MEWWVVWRGVLVIKPSVTVTRKELPGFARFKEEVKKMKGSFVSVGVQGDKEPYPNGATVAQVAMWNEFGTEPWISTGKGATPERSFFRTTLVEKRGEITATRNEVITKVVQGRLTVVEALNTMGFRLMVAIQAKIRSNIPPPNAQRTLDDRKAQGIQTTETLVATGHLARSITFETKIKGAGK